MGLKKPLISDLRRQVEQEEKRWQLEKPLRERQAAIRNDKAEFENKKRKISTSKLLIIFLFINCTLIEIFTGWAMVKMLSLAFVAGTMIDFTPLVALIGAIVGEVFGYAIYSLKSTKENTVGGIVYDSVINNNSDNKEPSLPQENGVG